MLLFVKSVKPLSPLDVKRSPYNDNVHFRDPEICMCVLQLTFIPALMNHYHMSVFLKSRQHIVDKPFSCIVLLDNYLNFVV